MSVRLGSVGAATMILGVAVLTLSCGGADSSPENQTLTVHVVDSSGMEYDIREVPLGSVRLDPLTTPIGGTVALDAEFAQISTIRQQTGNRIFTITFRSGEEVSGRLRGHIEGTSDGLPKATPWAEVQKASVSLPGKLPKFVAPDGPMLRVSGDGVEPLELFGVRIETSWIVRHGTHSYRRDTAESKSLPFTVPREQMVREEWEIPIARLSRIELMPNLTVAFVDLGDGEQMQIEGEVGGRLTHVEGGASFVGVDHRGRWKVSLKRLMRAVIRAGEGRSMQQKSASIKLEFFARGPFPIARQLPVVGTVVDWDGRSLEITGIHLEPLRFRAGGERAKISPIELAQIEVFDNPWLEYDEGVGIDQWLDAAVTLQDGSELKGELNDRFGHLECRDTSGLIVRVPSSAIRRLDVAEVSLD